MNGIHPVCDHIGGRAMKVFRVLCLGIIFGLFALPAEAGAGKAAAKVVEETIELAAKRSGRVVGKAAESRLGRELVEATLKYGDDVMPLVREGGLEVLEQGAKHGDDFWRLCREVPAGSRALALHADDLMPLARRIGPDVLRLESRAPGLTVRIVEEFGDDAVKTLAKQPPQDVTRLLGYAAKADSPETEKLLYKTYVNSSNPSAFLDHLNWKHIMAGGLTAAMITTAWKTGNATETFAEKVGNATETLASEHPDAFTGFFDDLTLPFKIIVYALGALLIWMLFPAARCFRNLFPSKKSQAGAGGKIQEKTEPQ